MMQQKFAVTAGRNSGLQWQARAWAQGFGVPYLRRGSSGSLEELCQKHSVSALLVATKLGPQVFTEEGRFFFHPSMADLRLKHVAAGESDHLIEALALKPGMKVLDCTLGLASDAIVASYAVGAQGKVVGVEASPLLAFVVARGLACYETGRQDVDAAMRRIKAVHARADDYLHNVPPDSFDAVYFDPMFRFGVKTSANMKPLRPLAYEKEVNAEIIELALKAAPRVVIKERSESFLRGLGCTEIQGGRYSRVKYGIIRR